MLSYIIVILCSYIIGSIPSGLILGKTFWNVDLREHGSKNIGATNAWRTLGKLPGFIVFVADLLKGMIGVYLGMLLVGTSTAMIIGGIVAIIGHSLSLFLKFKGGKGVATGLGVIIMLMPTVSAIVFIIWLVIVMISKYVSLASIIAAICVPIFAFILGMPFEFVAFGVVAALFVIYRHKSNIGRLMNGTENKIKAGKR
ncbi:glycerol-3-phosphate 1-O-acyltransferase PlsY [Megamonas hypermegale]|uniref:glycerol-3-phosphate 1-O-acyltransferase PlsY n=1 Tax=Megamonas hypermegale TaxID=158847 RepID=UPI001958DBB5|nr:glycerol-3-phosphate 1-O-acyltransferase PlsY [Megamonas hypermegale]MBM6832420.1 glycerol-3-phosphate 1-O-acyltransferase PlsY [Megamonas hypermegale]